MCDCDEEELADDERPIKLTATMIERMFALEAALAGNRVPARTWEIFLGRASGGIPFAELMRLQHCRQIVIDEERRARRIFIRAHSRRSPSFLCVEAR